MRRPEDSSARPVLSGAALLLALAFSLAPGCGLVRPRPPPTPARDLSLGHTGRALLVEWANPQPFARVDLEVTGPDGRPAIVSPQSTAAGAAKTYLEPVSPGRHQVKVVTYTGEDPMTRAESPPVEYTVPLPFTGYLGLGDLLPGAAEPEPLSVVYLIHPGCPLAGAEGGGGTFDLKRIFRHMTANVLSEAFRSAVAIRSARDLTDMETFRDRDRDRGGDVYALVDPDLLAAVDFRPATARAAGQLCLRLLDLKECSGSTRLNETRSRLFNQRPLIAEGYARVGSLDDPATALGELREAWKDLLAEVLSHPRYLDYKNKLDLKATFFADVNGLEPQEIQDRLFFSPLPPPPAPAPEAAAETETPADTDTDTESETEAETETEADREAPGEAEEGEGATERAEGDAGIPPRE